MIMSLTPKQEAMQAKYVQMGIEAGLACGASMDKELVREITDKHRLQIGADKATNFLVFDSPSQAIKAIPQLTPANALYGSHDVDWLYHYLFYRIELGLIKETEPMMHLLELSNMIGWFWLSSDTTIITPRPSEIHLQTKPHDTIPNFRVLHNYNGPALKFADGTGVYSMQGLFIPTEYEWTVTTPADQLDPQAVMNIKNTEVRNEVIKKVGVKQLVDLLDKEIVDTFTCGLGNPYTLYQFPFDGKPRLYVSGICPSKGEDFFEPVPPMADNCQKSLNWREYISPIDQPYIPPALRT